MHRFFLFGIQHQNKENIMTKHFRKLIAMICLVCLISCLFAGFGAAGAETPEYTEIPLFVNGEYVGCGNKIDVTTYVPIRAFSEAMGQTVEVSWDGATCTVSVTMPGLEIIAGVGNNYMFANGRCFYIPNGIYNMNGTVYVPVREIAKAFGVGVEWNAEDWTVNIDTSTMSLITPASEFYNENDLYWLSRLINAESGNQPLEGKIGVGNVVLNRVADPTCPDSVYSVIFDYRYGVQFYVTVNGAINATPNEESVIAAMIALEGYSTVGDSLYFVNPQIGSSSWFARNCTYVATIGQHAFYAA